MKEANRSAEFARKKPEQRTVKLQTKNPVGFVSRGINATDTFNNDKEISAQPSFRQESLEKAVSEKLDEIEKKAKDHTRRKKTYQRISYRPPGNFAQLSKPCYNPLKDISNKYKRLPQHLEKQQKTYGNQYDTLTPKQYGNNHRTGSVRRPARFEREKRMESYSINEINSAVKTLMH